MKHLLTGMAVIAALAISAPVWAQPANPSGRMPAGGRQTSEPTNIPSMPSTSDTSSATPPTHHHARKASHGRMAGRQQSTGSTANQLNQEELARLQAGNTSMPAGSEMSPGAPPAPGVSASPQLNRMPAGGRPTSGTAR
jgi:hypothetical protein